MKDGDTKCASLEARLTFLEERLAYTEALLDESTQVINGLQDAVVKLQDQEKILAARQGEISAVRDLRDEVPPPHY